MANRIRHIEVASFIGLAAMTSGDITIQDVEPTDLVPILPVFERLGVSSESRARWFVSRAANA